MTQYTVAAPVQECKQLTKPSQPTARGKGLMCLVRMGSSLMSNVLFS